MIRNCSVLPNHRLAARAALLALCGLCAATASADIINVPGEYSTIQAAIDAARSGDEIVIEQGRYVETIDLAGKAVTVRSADPGDPNVVAGTIIDGAGAPHVLKCVSGEGPDTIIDGLTITGGNARGSGENRSGGGMYIAAGSPTIANCTFVDNRAVEGGAMMNVSANPTLINCTFSDNTAESGRGGGVLNRNSSPTVTDCVFWGNRGGGMLNLADSHPTVIGSVFASNSSGRGGGMLNARGSAPAVTNCTFTYNTADDGGGMYNAGGSPTVTNGTFTFNKATVGGGMYNAMASPRVTNCTFTGNAAASGGGMHSEAGAPVVSNCIFWGNRGGEIGGQCGSPLVTSSNVRGGYPGKGNIDADPLFADPTCGQCHLTAGSPCIDAGDSTVLAGRVPTDRRGNPRFADDPSTPDAGIGSPCVDMGAYEFQGIVHSAGHRGGRL